MKDFGVRDQKRPRSADLQSRKNLPDLRSDTLHLGFTQIRKPQVLKYTNAIRICNEALPYVFDISEFRIARTHAACSPTLHGPRARPTDAAGLWREPRRERHQPGHDPLFARAAAAGHRAALLGNLLDTLDQVIDLRRRAIDVPYRPAQPD